MVRRTLEYAHAVWDHYLYKEILQVENVQRKAAPFVKPSYDGEGCISAMMKVLQGQPL